MSRFSGNKLITWYSIDDITAVPVQVTSGKCTFYSKGIYTKFFTFRESQLVGFRLRTGTRLSIFQANHETDVTPFCWEIRHVRSLCAQRIPTNCTIFSWPPIQPNMRFRIRQALLSTAVLLVILPHSMSFQRAGRIARHFDFPSARQRNHRKSITPSWLFETMKDEVDPGVVEGTALRVLMYPHPSLRAENSFVTEDELKDGSIAKLAKEMLLVMYAAEGVGLAAPQVGVNKRLLVYNESGDRSKWLNEVVLVNPIITEFSEATDVETEGCLSFPSMNGEVQRSKWIKVEAVNLRGKAMKKKYKGWEARIFQHEYDHLNGVVYIDRLLPESKTAVEGRLAELVQEYDSADGEPAL